MVHPPEELPENPGFLCVVESLRDNGAGMVEVDESSVLAGDKELEEMGALLVIEHVIGVYCELSTNLVCIVAGFLECD